MEKHIEDPHVTREVLTIIRGPHRAGDSRSACDRYAKEARNPVQALVHKADKHPTRNTEQGPKDIVFTEANAKWVHHPHTNALVITVRMANSPLDIGRQW